MAKMHQVKVSCPGYMDQNGVWNNGFYCPQWGGPEENYCCGTDTARSCCPEPRPDKPAETSNHVPLIAGVAGGLAVLLCCLLACVFCRCCPVYKRRKRPQPEETGSMYDPRCPACSHGPVVAMLPTNDNACSMRRCTNQNCGYTGMQVAGTGGYTVTYTVCETPDMNWNPGFSPVTLTYPLDDPPPYTEERPDNKPQTTPSQMSGDSLLRSTSASRRRSSSNLLEMATALASDLEQELSAVAAAESGGTLKRTSPKHKILSSNNVVQGSTFKPQLLHAASPGPTTHPSHISQPCNINSPPVSQSFQSSSSQLTPSHSSQTLPIPSPSPVALFHSSSPSHSVPILSEENFDSGTDLKCLESRQDWQPEMGTNLNYSQVS